MTAAFATKPALSGLAFLIDQALPQTQCTRCGYPDCASYARAIAAGEAPINQCPPGGQEGVQRLAALTGQPAQPLNPQFGIEGPLTVARIDEAWCIGCTLCIKACPVDAILGANKFMHTVVPSTAPAASCAFQPARSIALSWMWSPPMPAAGKPGARSKQPRPASATPSTRRV